MLIQHCWAGLADGYNLEVKQKAAAVADPRYRLAAQKHQVEEVASRAYLPSPAGSGTAPTSSRSAWSAREMVALGHYVVTLCGLLARCHQFAGP